MRLNSAFGKVLSLIIVSFCLSGVALAGGGAKAPAPDFTLKTLSGDNLKLSEHRGEVVMINFWASWCGPCRQEMPVLDALYSQYKDLGFTILGVNVEEDPDGPRKLLKSIPVTFPILLDSDNRVSETYRVVAMPSTYLIDRDGNVRYYHAGYLPGFEKTYEAQIRELLSE